MSTCSNNEILLELSFPAASGYKVYEEDTGALDNFFSMPVAKGTSMSANVCLPKEKCFVVETSALGSITLDGQAVTSGVTSAYQLESDEEASSVTTTYLSTGATTDACFPDCPVATFPLKISAFSGTFQSIVWKVIDEGSSSVLAQAAKLSFRAKGSRSFWQTQVCIPQDNSCRRLVLSDSNEYTIRPDITVDIKYQDESIQMASNRYIALDLTDACTLTCEPDECPVEFFWRRSVRVAYMYPDIQWELTTEDDEGESSVVDTGNITNTESDLINYYKSCQKKNDCLQFSASVPTADFVPTPIGTEVVYDEKSFFQLRYDKALPIDGVCNFGGLAPEEGVPDSRVYREIMNVNDCSDPRVANPSSSSLSAFGMAGIALGSLAILGTMSYVIARRYRNQSEDKLDMVVTDEEGGSGSDDDAVVDPTQSNSTDDCGAN